MVKVCERHICFLRRGTTYEWVNQRQCDLCNLKSLPDFRAAYVIERIEPFHLKLYKVAKHLNKPRYTIHDAKQTKTKEE